MKDYSIENLISKFSEHAKEADENQRKLVADFLENNPGEPIQDHLKDDFNLPLALKAMCQSIQELQLRCLERGEMDERSN